MFSARLPFQVLSPVVPESDEPKSKKRKLNEETAPEQEAAKNFTANESALIESKENICKPVQETSSPVTVHDDKSGDSAITSTPDVSIEAEKFASSQSEEVKKNEASTSDHEGGCTNELDPIQDGFTTVDSDPGKAFSPKKKRNTEEPASDDTSKKVKSDASTNLTAFSPKSLTVDEDFEIDIAKPNSVKSVKPASEETPKKVKSDAFTKTTDSSPKSVIDIGKASPNSVTVEASINSSDSSSKSVKVDDNLRKGNITPNSVGRRSSKSSSPNTSKDSPPISKRLTPKQLLKQKESAKKKEEKEKLRLVNYF